MVIDIFEKIDGYHGVYVDRFGFRCAVKGTWALGKFLSWHTEDGKWVEIDGRDQGHVVKETIYKPLN